MICVLGNLFQNKVTDKEKQRLQDILYRWTNRVFSFYSKLQVNDLWDVTDCGTTFALEYCVRTLIGVRRLVLPKRPLTSISTECSTKLKKKNKLKSCCSFQRNKYELNDLPWILLVSEYSVRYSSDHYRLSRSQCQCYLIGMDTRMRTVRTTQFY